MSLRKLFLESNSTITLPASKIAKICEQIDDLIKANEELQEQVNNLEKDNTSDHQVVENLVREQAIAIQNWQKKYANVTEENDLLKNQITEIQTKIEDELYQRGLKHSEALVKQKEKFDKELNLSKEENETQAHQIKDLFQSRKDLEGFLTKETEENEKLKKQMTVILNQFWGKINEVPEVVKYTMVDAHDLLPKGSIKLNQIPEYISNWEKPMNQVKPTKPLIYKEGKWVEE